MSRSLRRQRCFPRGHCALDLRGLADKVATRC